VKSSILLFHRVNPKRDSFWDPMDPRLFESILSHVCRKYSVISLEELCLGQPKARKPLLAITFDDGYKDYLDYALPLLRRYKCPSSMYVVTDCVDRNLPTWTYVMDYLFLNTNMLRISEFDYGSDCRNFQTSSWKSKEEQLAYARRFKQFLKRVDNGKRSEIIDHFVRSFEDVSPPHDLMMTWDDLRSLRSEDVEIGSHTVSHPPLATIPDEAGLMGEMKVSAERIEREIGTFPLTVSYPVGSYNEMVKRVAKQSGYRLGLAVDQTFYRQDQHDLYEVPRIELYNESMLKSRARISGFYGAAKRLLRR
jgi:peptidoglycan/xylan/chitin deacetylase (PgdA/CDA1 family)